MCSLSVSSTIPLQIEDLQYSRDPEGLLLRIVYKKLYLANIFASFFVEIS